MAKSRKPAKHRSSQKMERATEEIKEQELTPAYKKRKIRQTAVELKSEIKSLCKWNGQCLSRVLGECCSMMGKDGVKAPDILISVFDFFVEEKGACAAFPNVVSEKAWAKRLER